MSPSGSVQPELTKKHVDWSCTLTRVSKFFAKSIMHPTMANTQSDSRLARES